jgi:hypothetical protein
MLTTPYNMNVLLKRTHIWSEVGVHGLVQLIATAHIIPLKALNISGRVNRDLNSKYELLK